MMNLILEHIHYHLLISSSFIFPRAKENGNMLKRDENVLNNAKQMGVEKKKKN